MRIEIFDKRHEAVSEFRRYETSESLWKTTHVAVLKMNKYNYNVQCLNYYKFLRASGYQELSGFIRWYRSPVLYFCFLRKMS